MGLASGVVAGLDVDEAVSVHRLDQPMFVGEPARPLAGQVLTQGLGIADADSGLAKRLADQPIEPISRLIRASIMRSSGHEQ